MSQKDSEYIIYKIPQNKNTKKEHQKRSITTLLLKKPSGFPNVVNPE